MSCGSNREQIHPKKIPVDDVLPSLKKFYGISPTEPPAQMEGGVKTAAWLLETDKGKFIAKIFALSKERPIERMVEEVSLCNYLTKHGIRTPKFISGKNGRYVEQMRFRNADFPIQMMKFEELWRLKPSSIKKVELQKIAKTAARMHKALLDCPQKDKIKKEDRFRYHIAPLGSFEIFSKSPNSSIYTKTEIKNIKKLDEEIIRFASSHLPKKGLTESILHGDLALDHAQFLSNGEVYLFDFSDFMWGPIAHELSVMLVHLFHEEDISFQRWEQLKEWWLSGYSSVFKLGSEDFKAIKPLIIRRAQGVIVYLCDVAIRIKRKVNEQGIRRRYKLADYLLRN